MKKEDVPTKFQRRFSFGWLLAKIVEILFYRYDRSKSQDWRRYRHQSVPEVPSLDEWNHETEQSFSLCMHFTAACDGIRPSKREEMFMKYLDLSITIQKD